MTTSLPAPQEDHDSCVCALDYRTQRDRDRESTLLSLRLSDSERQRVNWCVVGGYGVGLYYRTLSTGGRTVYYRVR